VYAALRFSLLGAEGAVSAYTAALLQMPIDALPPRTPADVHAQTRVLNASLTALFTPSPLTRVSPFALQLLRLIEASVNAALIRNAPTPEVADAVAPPPRATPEGRRRPRVAPKGTALNAMVARVGSVTAAALWALPAASQRRALALGAEPPDAWRWYAVLDARTCAICRPLHGTTAPTPDAFPFGPPALHPRCRCVVLPVYTAA
jgi:hypothetical protein